MKRSPDGTVQYTDSPVFVDCILGLFAIAFIAGAWLNANQVSPNYFVVTILAVFAALCLVGILFQDRKVYRFDPSTQTMAWSSRGLFGRSSGTAAFKDIAVTIDSTTGGSGSGLTYRVMLTTPDGAMPLSRAYDGNLAGVERSANELRALLGQTAGESLIDDSIRQMAKSGNTIQAVKLLRDQSGASLNEAVQHVDKLRSGKNQDPTS